MKLNYKRTILVGFAFFLICTFWNAYDTIIPKILTDKFGMTQANSGIIMALDNVLALFMLPLFGTISDKCRHRLGRRTPFILFGTIIAAIMLVCLSFVDNAQLKNISAVAKIDDPAAFEPSMLYLAKPHYLRLKEGESVAIPMVTGNVTYDMRPVKSGVKFSNYDKDIVGIRCGKLTAKKTGYTYVTATMDDLSCEFLVYVDEYDCKVPDWLPHPEKEAVSFLPLITEYAASLGKREMKQLRGLATYADASWFEVCGDDGVTYENHNPELFEIRADGNVLPTGKLGRGTVTLRLGDHAFDVGFTVGE